jgi:hypothetical protein
VRSKFLLADSAEVRDGLLFLLGGGWTEVGPPPQVFAIAGLIEVEWGETNTRHEIVITIEDDDGVPLLLPTQAGNQPFRLAIGFDVGRPPGSAAGRSFNLAVAIPILPIPWQPGKNYVLKIAIDSLEPDRIKFFVRATPPPPLTT